MFRIGDSFRVLYGLIFLYIIYFECIYQWYYLYLCLSYKKRRIVHRDRASHEQTTAQKQVKDTYTDSISSFTVLASWPLLFISILNGRMVWTHIYHCSFTVECRHPLRPKPMKDLYLGPVRTQFSPLES